MKAIHRMLKHPPEDEDVLLLTQPVVSSVRVFGLVNWRGLWTLTVKENLRFLKIFPQTVLSPLVMTLLFYAVFVMGVGGAHKIGSVSFINFVIPGLVMMSVAQSAFINTASSLILSKLQNNLVDVLMPPLSPFELTLGYSIAGLVRGVLVGAVSLGVLALLTPLPLYSVPVILYFAVMGALMLSLMGLITGIWGDKFDHLGGIQSFIIMPATFLSGTFFTITSLPEKWQFACLVNPFFYMIDGFRGGFTGVFDGPLWGGIAYLFLINLFLFNVAYWMFARGTGLKT